MIYIGILSTKDVRAARYLGVGMAEAIKKLTMHWPDGVINAVDELCTHCEIAVERAAQP